MINADYSYLSYTGANAGQRHQMTVQEFITAKLNPLSATTEVSLDLSNSRLNPTELGAILPSLRNHQFREINLCYNQLGDQGAKMIANAIKAHQCRVNSLIFIGNQIGDEGALALIGAMEQQANLRIELMRNQIGPKGAVAYVDVEKQRSSRIDLSHNKIGDEGATAVVNNLLRDKGIVTELYLTHNEIGKAGDRDLSDIERSVKVYHLVKIVPFTDAHPNLFVFLGIIFFPFFFILPFMKSEVAVEGCDCTRRPTKIVPYVEAHPIKSLFLCFLFFPIFLLPFWKEEVPQ